MKRILLILGIFLYSSSWAKTPTNSIEKKLAQCINQDTSASGGGIRICQQSALANYEKLLKQKDYLQKDLLQQYSAVDKACEQPFAQKSVTSSIDEDWILECKIDNSRRFYNIAKFLKDNNN